jgi:hypothetical protein
VEHFAHLPPATYGEPPDLAAEVELGTRRAKESRPTGSYLWTSVAMVALGGLVAGGGALGWSYYKRHSRVTAPEPAAPARAIDIVVKQPTPEVTPVVDEGEGGIPQAEPLAEEKSALEVVKPAPEAVKPTVSQPTATPVKRAKHVARSVRKRAQAADLPAAQPASDDSWEDPYR